MHRREIQLEIQLTDEATALHGMCIPTLILPEIKNGVAYEKLRTLK